MRVETQKAEQQPTQENEVRITAAGKTRNYISYATNLLTEKEHTSVILKAMGKAINKTVTIGEEGAQPRQPPPLGTCACVGRCAGSAKAAPCALLL